MLKIGMANKLNFEKQTQILAMLVEGQSINSTSRIAGASKNTVLKLLAELGEACALYQDRVMEGLTCKKIQCDAILSFVGMQGKNVQEEVRGVFGLDDVYTWTSIDADTKLMPCWHVGTRSGISANAFMIDLVSRLAHCIQLSTDGHKMYINSVEDAFSGDIDYAMLVKQYGNERMPAEAEHPYSPAESTGAKKLRINGDPDMKHVSTSHVERVNLTMRMNIRRFTRLTNAFSKKLENHMHAISLFHMHYNFCRIHKSLHVPPAMEAGLTDHVWDIEEVLMMAQTMRKNVVTQMDSN